MHASRAESSDVPRPRQGPPRVGDAGTDAAASVPLKTQQPGRSSIKHSSKNGRMQQVNAGDNAFRPLGASEEAMFGRLTGTATAMLRGRAPVCGLEIRATEPHVAEHTVHAPVT
ncbi:hypothetical protein TREES_T100008319 [Tupaia chinensis]|uniref:Uncharacterized protein n=1 Tax=Tupaia chinensis TaxID=246437 RepID=L9LBE4_TUPCH|nr:hypothetical protein TREES_T100008319 [Tupaia chinensis]